MNLESPKVVVSKNPQELFTMLEDLRNFKKLMPESISKFEVIDENSFVFALKGMPEIALQKKSKTPYTQIVMGAVGDKIPFTLITNIIQIAENQSEVQLLFEGSFNPMMAMMVKNPISKFIETLATKMQKL